MVAPTKSPVSTSCVGTGSGRAQLILEEADIGAVSRQLELAPFMDAKLDVAKMPA